MAQNLSNFDSVLKDAYEGAVRETLNSEVPLFKLLSESDRNWSGRRVVFPIHTSRNSGVGARSDGGTLPTAGEQDHSLSVISSTYQYGRIEVTGPTISSGKNAFAEAMVVEMEGMVRDLKNDLGRQTWGTGDGRLCQVGADGASASALAVYNRFAESGQPGARYIYVGQSIDGGTVAAPTADFSSQTVTAVAISSSPGTTTDTVTIGISSITVSQCDTFLFNRGAGGLGIEMNGIMALVDVYSESNMWGSNAFAGATIQGIARSTVSNWNALVLGNSGTERVIDGNLMQSAFDKIHIESAMEPDLIMGQHDVVRAFLDAVSSDRRYGTANFDAGFSGLSYNGVPLERDRLAPYNSLLVMNRAAIKQYTLLDFQWAADDGAILSRVANKDAFEAYFRAYKQLGLDANPKCALMIRDIRVDL
jgi:hypothetical protein